MLKKTFLGVLLFFVISCASAYRPLYLYQNYNGMAYITTPIPSPKYNPADISFRAKCEMSNGQDISYDGNVIVTKNGDRLLWEGIIHKTGADIPIKILTDSSGKNIKTNLDLICFDFKSRDTLIPENIILQMFKNSPLKVTDKDIVSGDVIFISKFRDNVSNVKVNGESKGYLQGRAYYRKKVVLVTSMLGKYAIEWKGGKFDLNPLGYILIDPVTFHVVYSQILISDMPNQGCIRITYQADIAPL